MTQTCLALVLSLCPVFVTYVVTCADVVWCSVVYGVVGHCFLFNYSPSSAYITNMNLVRLHIAQKVVLINGGGVGYTVATNDGVGEVQDLAPVAGVCQGFRVPATFIKISKVNTHKLSTHTKTFNL